MLRIRLLIAVTFFMLGVGLTTLFQRLNPRQIEITLPSPPPRTPASLPLIQDPPRACQNIYRAVCQRKGIVRDPTGTVLTDIEAEYEILKHYERIIHDNPSWTSTQVDEALAALVYTPESRKRLEQTYAWVQTETKRFIDREPDSVFPAALKAKLKDRVSQVRLQLPPPIDLYADEPDLLTKSDAFYERLQDGSMRLRVGGAYLYDSLKDRALGRRSRFNLIFTLAHELAHSIDPCELKSAGITSSAIDHLSACFVEHGLVLARKTRTECGGNDQLSETYADWLAVHITALALSDFSLKYKGQPFLNAATNAVRDLCEQDDGLSEEDIQVHPSPNIRIDRIFGRNPTIRSMLGCGPVDSGPKYCELSSADYETMGAKP